MKILIADDDDIALALLERTLQKAGYDVVTAADGHEALEIIRQGECKLVISDWEMPKLTGVELCEAVRNENLPGYVYMILLTSRASPEALVEGMNAGADDFITKPFYPQELIVRVRAGVRVLSLQMREVAIFALAKLTESRDPETGHHLERVQHYAEALARELAKNPKYRDEINEEYIRLIYLTTPLHDIGKVGIPDCVLLKPGRLSDQEFAIMKSHTCIGAETLDAALQRYPKAQFLMMARDIAATHHERYDGKGYPSRLVGDEIPLCGRIVALADVYDALSSKRVYKEAFTHTITRAMILEESGKQFDPDVVDAFLAVEQQFLEIRHRFSDAPAEAAVGM